MPSLTQALDRRRHERMLPREPITVAQAVPVRTLFDVQVLNVSTTGVALHSRQAVKPGQRLRFTTATGAPPILAEVLACESMPDGGHRIRCRCLLGGFDQQPLAAA